MIDRLNPDYSDTPGRRAVPHQYKHGSMPCEHIDVSVVTPYYNTKEFFVETFVSLLAQSLQNWEWVIVDDGSTDASSVSRLADVAAQDPRILVVRQENAGPAAARNTGFRASSGRYICLLDSDDMVEPTYLEKCVWFLESNPEFAFCNTYSVVFDEQEYLWTKGFERGVDFLRANSGPPISVIRRQAYADCGGFDAAIRFGHEDWDFWLAMAKVGHWGYTIPEYLQWYRKLGSGRFEQIMRSGQVNDDFEKLMLEKYKGLDKHFPAPIPRFTQPYETVNTDVPVCNPLASNDSGRRIMFIIPWMVMGGADRVNLDLIEGLVAKGHQTTVCATLKADHCWEHQFSQFTPDVFVLPNFLNRGDFARFLGYLILSRKIDTVVVTGSTIGYQFLPYLSSVAPDTAFIDMCHVEEPNWQNGGHPRFGVGYQDALDLNVVTTKHLAEWMAERGADKERIRVMYTGVRAPVDIIRGQALDKLAIRSQLRKDVPTIIFAGRICEQKRPALLVNILKAARDSGLEFQALIIGVGELWGTLESAVKRYDLESCVHLLGALPHAQWLEFLAEADVLLMPSEYEGISVALLEAMAAGVVPVVARVGGQDEIITDATGYLIPQEGDEVRQYVEALAEILSNPELREVKAVKCRQLIASSHSWETTIRRFEDILTEAHDSKEARTCRFSLPMARELVTQALENQRMSDAMHYQWHSSPLERGRLSSSVSRTNALLMHLAHRFVGTKLGQSFVKNPKIRRMGKAVLTRFR